MQRAKNLHRMSHDYGVAGQRHTVYNAPSGSGRIYVAAGRDETPTDGVGLRGCISQRTSGSSTSNGIARADHAMKLLTTPGTTMRRPIR